MGNLRELLNESTSTIMREFYFLLSKFFISLKQRNISVEDMKTHLMVLKAYQCDSDDSKKQDSKKQQSLFQDKVGTLKRASTMNAVFEVLQGFCSFVDYGIIEHLILLLGSDEDNKRLEHYKEKFTDYAKRRVCECPSMVAASRDGQCMYVKVESRFEKFTLHELCVFRKNISDLLKVSRYTIRLCSIEKGCVKLTFWIPNFVREGIFPLTSKQEMELKTLGVRRLTCEDLCYELFEVCI